MDRIHCTIAPGRRAARPPRLRSASRVTRSRVLPALSALSLLGAGGCDRNDPVAPAGGGSTVEGRVAMVKTAAGVPNAIVALVRDGEVAHAEATDRDGHFTIAEVMPGEYVAHLVGLELTGVDPRSVSFEPREQPVTAGDEPVQLTFAGVTLVPARIVGDVSCDGLPVENARVRVVGGDHDSVVATNGQGRYAATDLAPGSYAVLLQTDGLACSYAEPVGVVRLRTAQAGSADFTGTP